MKNKSICNLSLMFVFFMFFISLTGFDMFEKNQGVLNTKTERKVVNNLFTSNFPEMKLQMNPELKYTGSAVIAEYVEAQRGHNTDPRERYFDADSYVFAQTDPRKRITRGVIIRILVMHGDPSQEAPEIFTKKSKNILTSGETKILKEDYDYAVYTEPELFAPKEKDLLKNARISPCFLVKRLSLKSGLGHKSRVHVIYFEDVSGTCGKSPCGACLDPEKRSAEQKEFFQEFTDRSFASIRFQDTSTIEDTTSKYVDGVPKGEPAPMVTAPPVSQPRDYGPGKADTLERRLETLKRLYEKNLISQEEYEKKKAEILNEL
jgi:hypothetical protein